MADHAITIADLERIAGDAGRYFARLDEAWGRASAHQPALKAVEEFCRGRRIPRATLAALTGQAAPGCLYVELPQGAREFHGQAVQLLLDCCSQEIVDGDETAWNKWREFAGNIYYGIVDELYHNFTADRPDLALVFELAYRQLMFEMAQAWWEGQPPRTADHRPAIDRRLSLELGGLLRPVRQRALADRGYDQSLLESALDRSWGLEFDPANCGAGQLAPMLREHRLSPWLFSELFHLLYSAQVKNQEEVVYDTLRTAAVSKPDEITALVAGKLPKASELALREIQKIMVRRAQELEAKLAQELADLQKFSLRVKKQTADLIAQSNAEVAKAVENRLFSDNLANLSSRIGDTLVQFQRGLFSQLWYLQDLERKERTFQGYVEKCRALQRMPAKDLLALLTEKTVDASLSVNEHLAQYRILDLEIGQDWDRWAAAAAKQLLDLLRQAVERHESSVAALEREISRRGTTDPKLGQLRTELREAAADLAAVSGLIENREAGRAYHVEKIVTGYRAFLKDAAEPLMTWRRLSGLVRLWPPPLLREPPLLRQQELLDEVRYVGEKLRRTGRCYLMTAQGPVAQSPAAAAAKEGEVRSRIVRRHGKPVSVLAYDIRGSSFMSAKLRNADKEREIKNKLGYLICQAIRQHGGFAVKDTGDGGLAWFGDNAPELAEKCYKEVTTGKGVKLRHSLTSGAELTLLPSVDAGRQALSCAAEMLRLAEKFIQENFTNYRDWFKDAQEREIFHEGMSYAVLPPEFKALFRIGVGVASGEPGRDVSLALNAFGDVDLTGVLVNNACLYSTGRDPAHSRILADHPTCFNLLLTADRFVPEYLREIFAARAAGPEEWERKLADAMGLTRTVLADGSYLFPGAGLRLARAGCQCGAYAEGRKGESLCFGTFERPVALADDGSLTDADGSEIRLLYEVQPAGGEE